jgi:NAD(P)-dependent dehydrogenase (short-subunit alcohol dehydrogenase family)
MELKLNGKRAFVSGSTSGIGEAIAKALAAEGVDVIVHGLDREEAARVVGDIATNNGRALVANGDLSTDEGAKHAVDEALSSLKGVDILVNNAGVYKASTWEDATSEQWNALYNINVVSVARLVRLLVPQMKESGWGRIIQISSGEASQPFRFMPDYAATKAAMINVTVSLAKDLAESGVTVNTVSPGIIVTPALEKFYRQLAANRGWGTNWKDIEKGVLREILYNPVGRLGRVEDVANLVAYLSSPLADYINGANFRVDGGSTACIN